MLLHGALSAYLRDTAGNFSDPLHGHSFCPVQLQSLSTVDRSLLFFRECLLCGERLLAIARPVGRRRRLSKTTGSSVCQCLSCGRFCHRECLTAAHCHRTCRDHDSGMPKCSHAPAPDALLLPEDRDSTSEKRAKRPETFTLASLIEELDSNSLASVGPSAVVSKTTGPSQQLQTTASKFAKRLAPVLAAGGVVGAIAMGPAAGVLAGLNMLVASVGAETVMAGIGLTASAAAAATVTHQSKVRAAQRKKERLKRGEWAMEICWNCKKNFPGGPSDEACRKDAEFSRRFQFFGRLERKQSADGDKEANDTKQDTIPDDAEVYRFLFAIFSSPTELLGQMNMQLCEAFRQRFMARHQQPKLVMRRLSFKGPSSSAALATTRALAKDTLQDTKMYLAHILGATLQSFPSLASTPEAMSSCTLAVERVVYDDIYALVFSEFQRTFKDAETAFIDNLVDIRREQKYHSSALLQQHLNGEKKQSKQPVLAEELQKAETKMFPMMKETCSPLQKLVLLCDAFRSMCCFAERLHQSASNTDMLIPILCALLVECPRVCGAGSDFVAEIAFISFFTNGGGKGVEGYVLTTFQAAIQVIAAVDLPSGHAKELELFFDEDGSADDDAEGDDEDEDEFFDAVPPAT